MNQLEYIECDQCGNQIQLENVIASHLQKDFDKKLQEEKAKISKTFQQKEVEFSQKEKEFEEKRKRQNDLFQEKLEKEKVILKKEIQSKTSEEFKQKILAQQEELQLKSERLVKLQQTEIEMERLKREMGEKEKEIELKMERKMIERQKEIEEKISKRVLEENQFNIREKDKQLGDLKKQIEEMKRKAEQGSMQLQGEVQELAIEEFLISNFPFDQILEIKKGARGGDCIQVVNTRTQANCGTIYYESKRTKDFSPGWLEKFKADMRTKGADIGVMVTKARPKDMDRMGLKEGIWICSFEEFKGLCFVLRNQLIKINQVSKMQENKGDKMELLYEFLTSNEFRMEIEGIVEGFTQLQNDLQKEKNAMNRMWSQREKQIQKVILNTVNMYGSIKGIAGNAVQDVKQLELDGGEANNELF